MSQGEGASQAAGREALLGGEGGLEGGNPQEELAGSVAACRGEPGQRRGGVGSAACGPLPGPGLSSPAARSLPGRDLPPPERGCVAGGRPWCPCSAFKTGVQARRPRPGALDWGRGAQDMG